ncbi:MAG TPA: cytochrome c [Gaiellaceae bacterium]|jgi:mono/diheme cytochrome c family protein
MLRINIGRRVGLGLASLALVAALVAPTALGHGSAAGPTIGTKAATKAQLSAGKSLFSTTCSACHALKAAGAVGTIGPNLDKSPLAEATLIKAITKGGASVMTKAAAAKYSTAMQPYSSLGTLKINEIAAYIYASTKH